MRPSTGRGGENVVGGTHKQCYIPSQAITLCVCCSSGCRCRSRPGGRRRRYIFRKASIIVPNATSDACELRRTRDLSEGVRRVVRVSEPVKPPVTACLKLGWHGRALRAVRNAPVLSAPGTAELGGAAVEYASAAAGNLQVELVSTEVSACINRLYQHDFALGFPGRQSQGVTSTAPAGFRAATNRGCCESIRDKIIDCPRSLVGTCKSCPTALTARSCLVVGKRAVLDVAGIGRVGDVGLARPRT